MDDDDFDRREKAMKSLGAAGAGAVPLLEEAAQRAGPEVRWRAAVALRDVECRATVDDLELTAMATLTFLGAGYSPLSRDIYEGYHFGTVVTAGLKWLLDRQKTDGSFGGGGAAADAWAALALSEAFGMTARDVYREPAQRAVDFLVNHPAADSRALFYQIMALKSGELSDLRFPREALATTTKALVMKRAEEPFSIFTRAAVQIAQIFTYKRKQWLDLTGIPGMHPSLMDMETLYVVDLALFQADGPGGDHWKGWRRPSDDWMRASQEIRVGRCDQGTWEASGTSARLKATALGTMSQQHYYAYNVFK
jgi:hypothetical protein